MDLFGDLAGVTVFQDDILVSTADEESHWEVLKSLFDRLALYNVKLGSDKCEFFQSEVEFLGHEISGEGIRPKQSKVESILNANDPVDAKQLHSFFLPECEDLQKLAHLPVYRLTILQRGCHQRPHLIHTPSCQITRHWVFAAILQLCGSAWLDPNVFSEQLIPDASQSIDRL